MNRMALVLVLALLTLVACRHGPTPATGTSSFKVIEARADNRPPSSAVEAKEPVSRAQFREASVQEKSIVLPVYPPRALAAKAGAAQVGVHVVVDAQGNVADVRPSLLAVSISPPGFAEDFRDAAETAVRRWKFHPARIQHIETVTTDGFTYQRVTRTEIVDAEFDLVFNFTPSGKVEAK